MRRGVAVGARIKHYGATTIIFSFQHRLDKTFLIHTLTYTFIHKRKHMYASTNVGMNSRTNRVYLDILRYIRLHIHAHVRACTHITYKHTHTYTHTCRRASTKECTHTYKYSHTPHVYTRTCKHLQIHSNAHTCTRVCICLCVQYNP